MLKLILLLLTFNTTFANTTNEITTDKLAQLETQSLEVAWQIIKHYEKCKTKPYIDQAGISTIGYGERTNKRTSITCNESEQNVRNYIKRDIAYLKNYGYFQDLELNANQMGAILSLAFNVGVDTLLESRQNFNSKAWWSSFAKVNGRTSNGLVTRREHEYNIYNKVEK